MIAGTETDSELFKALLTGIKAPKLEQRVMPWLLPNLVGGIVGLELVTLNSQQVAIIVNVGSPTTIGGWT